MQGQFDRYLKTLGSVLDGVVATDGAGNPLPMGFAVASTASAARRVHDVGGKAMFIGNGGSAAIASHMAIDFSKNGRVRSLAFNDGAALTCLGNDHGFAEVFSRQMEFHARPDDLLFAISSSGRSADILNGVAAARDIGCRIVTLSGFTADNPLRLLGDINLFVPSDAYGFVEISHLVLCHAVVDFLSGQSGTNQSGANQSGDLPAESVSAIHATC
jgi:D-sedoheptulose 7-phosphate isomerase